MDPAASNKILIAKDLAVSHILISSGNGSQYNTFNAIIIYFVTTALCYCGNFTFYCHAELYLHSRKYPKSFLQMEKII